MLALPSGGFEMSGETKKRAEQDEQGRRGSEVERRGRIEMSGEIKKRGAEQDGARPARARWSKPESKREQARSRQARARHRARMSKVGEGEGRQRSQSPNRKIEQARQGRRFFFGGERQQD